MNYKVLSNNILNICLLISLFLFTNCSNFDNGQKNANNEQITIALEACKNIEKTPSDTLAKYSQIAYQLSQENGSDHELMYATFYKAQYFANIGNFDSASFYNDKIMMHDSIPNDSLFIKHRSLILKGTNLYRQGKFKEALEWFFKIYPEIENSTSTNELLRLINNIGVTNQGLLRYPEAIRWFKKVLEFDLSKKKNFEAVVTYNISDSYININKLDSAILYCNRAISISHEENILIIKANSLNTLAKIKTEQKKLIEAKALVLDALEIHKAEHAYFFVVSDLAQLSEIYRILQQHEEAEKMGLEAIEIAKQYNLDAQLYGAYSILLEYYKNTHNYEKALKLSDELVETLRTNNHEASAKAMAEMEVKYETSKKEQQIKEQHYQLKEKNNIIFGSIGLLLILLLLGIMIFRSFRYKQQQKLQTAIMQEQTEATRAIIKAEEAERDRMSQTLHDGVGQLLSGLKMNLQALHERIDFQENEKIYNNSIGLLNEAVQEIRNVSHQMQPNHIINLGLKKALQGIIDKLDNNALEIQLHIDDEVQQLKKDIQLIIYRILQECLHNTVKHAQASIIHMTIRIENKQLQVVYEDNGKGINDSIQQAHKGIGLSNIYSRIRYLQGKHTIISAPGAGFKLTFQVPIK